jgi:hypothetical protein
MTLQQQQQQSQTMDDVRKTQNQPVWGALFRAVALHAMSV